MLFNDNITRLTTSRVKHNESYKPNQTRIAASTQLLFNA